MSEKKYVICDSHAKHEAYAKEDIDKLLNDKANNNEVYKKTEIDSKPTIYSGTTTPDSELGKDGDIYLKY